MTSDDLINSAAGMSRLKRTELTDRWIAALRSGKYKSQAAGQLRTGDAFGVLGVLCDVFDPTRWEGNLYQDHETSPRKVYVPSDVLEAVGADDINWQDRLYDQEDVSTQAQLADWIDREYAGGTK